MLFCITALDTMECGNNSLSIESPISVVITDLATNEKYDRALALIDSLSEHHPGNPYIPMLLATVLSARAMDFEDELDNRAILDACNQVESASRQYFTEDDASGVRFFYLGMVEMYRGIVLQRQGSMVRCLRHVMRAGKLLQQAAKLNPECWDIYYGLGMYQYHSSSRAGILRSIGLISDKRREGIRNIETAMQKGVLTRNSARNSLAWIAMENGEYDRAIRLSRESLVKYPDRRLFLWCLGKALIRSRRWEESIPVFQTLLHSVRSESRNNHYNELSCIYFLAKAHFMLGRWSEVVRFADQATVMNLSRKVASRKKGDIADLKKMKKKAEKNRRKEK